MFSVMSARLIDKAWDLKKPLADRRPVGNFDSMDGEHPVAACLSSVYGLSPSRAMHTLHSNAVVFSTLLDLDFLDGSMC